MRTNLWSDVDAVARLARSRHEAEAVFAGAPSGHLVLPSGAGPAFPGRLEFDVHAESSPARMVGGDSCDFFFLTESILAIGMTDVAGKGVPAALMMEVTRSMVRQLCCVCASPGETLTRVNRILHDADLDAMYLTIFLGWYDTSSGILLYANAGHPIPYRIDSVGSVSSLGRVTGPILGIFDVEAYENDRTRLEAGEKIVLYTDGVTEAESPEGDFFGPERLEALLARHASQTPERICRAVSGALDAFQAGVRRDDATLLALHRLI